MAEIPQAFATLLARLEDLDAYTHQAVAQFPKSERHVLAADVRGQVNRIIRAVHVAWKRKQKSAALFDLDIEIEVLRGLVRKAHRLHYINTHRLEVWSRHVNEVGRMVGAWIKHEQARG